jgi:hypothetical protein
MIQIIILWLIHEQIKQGSISSKLCSVSDKFSSEEHLSSKPKLTMLDTLLLKLSKEHSNFTTKGPGFSIQTP